MKKNKDDLSRKIARELQLPEGAVGNTFKIEFSGNSNAFVDGCLGIVEYDESVISLNLGNMIVRFKGCGLEINTFSENQAVISGTIATMEFSS